MITTRNLTLFRSFRNRLALYAGLLTLTLGLVTASFASTIASAHLKRATNQYLHSVASSIANAMTSLIEERQREVALLSEHPLLRHAQVSADQVRTILNQMGKTYKHYSWIGFASTSGEVLVAKDSLLEGKNVSQRPWFKEGLTKSFVGDVHEAVMLSALLDTKDTEPLRFIDVASPVRKEDGTISGVIATHINWEWVDELLQNALPSPQEHIEVYVVTGNGDVLYPYSDIGQLQFPTALLGKEATLSFEHDDTIYLSASSQVLASQKTSLDWYVIIRQPEAIALASIKTLHWQIFIASFVFVAIAVFVAFRLASRFSEPIEILAVKACRVEAGDETQQFRQPSNIREVDTLSNALESMKNTLVERQRRIQHANKTLEKQVENRTRELEEANRKLERQARQDPLTNLHNRRAVNEYLHQAFAELKRTNVPYSVAVVDIDNFKQVNDTYGHECGDDALKHVAKVLSNNSRESDFVARSGGEEFLIVMPATDIDGARVLAEKLRKAAADSPPPTLNELTVSIGIANVRLEDQKDSAVISRADKALYRAKNLGRNRVEMSSQA